MFDQCSIQWLHNPIFCCCDHLPEADTTCKLLVNISGFPRILENSGKSLNFYWKISRTWKVSENNLGTGKSWKTICKVLENPVTS